VILNRTYESEQDIQQPHAWIEQTTAEQPRTIDRPAAQVNEVSEDLVTSEVQSAPKDTADTVFKTVRFGSDTGSDNSNNNTTTELRTAAELEPETPKKSEYKSRWNLKKPAKTIPTVSPTPTASPTPSLDEQAHIQQQFEEFYATSQLGRLYKTASTAVLAPPIRFDGVIIQNKKSKKDAKVKKSIVSDLHDVLSKGSLQTTAAPIPAIVEPSGLLSAVEKEIKTGPAIFSLLEWTYTKPVTTSELKPSVIGLNIARQFRKALVVSAHSIQRSAAIHITRRDVLPTMNNLV